MTVSCGFPSGIVACAHGEPVHFESRWNGRKRGTPAGRYLRRDPPAQHAVEPEGTTRWSNLLSPPCHAATARVLLRLDMQVTRRDLLKIVRLGTLGGWDLLADGRGARAADAADLGFSPVPLRFDEPADRPAGSTRWPVTVGVPFANGALTSIEGLSISVADAAQPAQFDKALDWRHGAKTISWVHCDFQTTVGSNAKPAATLHLGQAGPAPAPGVTVVDNGAHYTVDTGAISFTCSKSNFNLLDSLAVGDKALLRSSSLYWKDTWGTTYEAKHVVDSVRVEKSGPLRAVLRYDGWYQAGHGTPKLRYFGVAARVRRLAVCAHLQQADLDREPDALRVDRPGYQ